MKKNNEIQEFEKIIRNIDKIARDSFDKYKYLDLMKMMCELKKDLIKKGAFSEVEKEFVNESLRVYCLFLEKIEDFDSFSKEVVFLKSKYLYELGLVGHTRGYFTDQDSFDLLLCILEKDTLKVWEAVQKYKKHKRELLLVENNIDIKHGLYYDISVDTCYDKETFVAEFCHKYNAYICDRKVQKDVEVPIVLASDNNYVLPMLVTIASLLKNADARTHYNLNLLISGNFTEKNRRKIKQIFENYPGHKLKFINMQSAYKDAYLRVAHISTATYYRLQLPSILQNIKKCIYLDVDVVVNTDLSCLYEIDMESYYLAGVCAAGYYESAEKIEYHKKRLQLPEFDKYLNAGVLVMNLKKMREDELENEFNKLLDKKWESQDQDILNVSCYGKIRTIDFKYNVMTKYPVDNDAAYDDTEYLRKVYTRQEWNRGRKSPAIIHYADRIKPWHVAGSVLADEWWDVVKQMPAEIAADFMTAYITDIMETAKEREKKAALCENQLIKIKSAGAVENERILKYKLQYENKNQKHKINELSQKLNSSNTVTVSLVKERDKLATENKMLKKQNMNLAKKSEDLKRLRQSKSYKIGRWITCIPRKIICLFR